jgi:hypothetical protein
VIRIIAFINDTMAVREILAHLGRRASHRPVARRRGRWLMPGSASSTLNPNRHRDEFDQRFTW